jgi:hypothetical protein
MPDDKYKGADTAERPQATTTTKVQEQREQDPLMEAFTEKKQHAGKVGNTQPEKALLFIESKNKSVNSAMIQEDFEVFLRVQTYKNKCNRLAKKLITQIKWLPMTHRFSIWQESRIRMHEYKLQQ